MKTFKLLFILAVVLTTSNISAQDADSRRGKIRFSLNGGYSLRTDEIDSNASEPIKEFLNEQKSGYHFGADIGYFFVKNLGLGVKYNSDAYKAELNNVSIPIGDGITVTSTSDDIKINFIGPTVYFLSNGEKGAFSANLSYGFLNYKNNNTLNSIDVDITGKTSGIAFDLGYEFFIVPNVSFGIQMSYLTGVIDKFTVTSGNLTEDIELESEDREGINRNNYSAGLRFYLN